MWLPHAQKQVVPVEHSFFGHGRQVILTPHACPTAKISNFHRKNKLQNEQKLMYLHM